MQRKGSLMQRWLRNTMSITLAVVLLCILVLCATVSGYYYSNMRAGMEAKARTATVFFETYVGRSYQEFYRSSIRFAQNFDSKEMMELQFINTGKRVVASSYIQLAARAADTPDIDAALTTRQISSYTGINPDTGERIMAVSSPLIYSNGEVIGVLRYVTGLGQADRSILHFSLLVAAVGLALLLIVYVSGRYYLRSILEPVLEITEVTRRIASGSYGVQISRKFDDEIGELVDTINDMSVRLGCAERTQSEFISSVSHELRTPLTAISGWSETLIGAGTTTDDDATQRGLGIILSESRRLTSMVEELLDFTRLQDGRFTLQVEETDLCAEFANTVFMYAAHLRREGITLEYLRTEDEIPTLYCDGARMKQVFLNILDNAAKHGGEGKRIIAWARRSGAYVCFCIRDFGPGIPEEKLPLVKKKFYKGSTRTRGSGIGLAVSDEIIALHAGTLTLENAEGGGCLVTLRLPVGLQ